jgi:hypothetical protein
MPAQLGPVCPPRSAVVYTRGRGVRVPSRSHASPSHRTPTTCVWFKTAAGAVVYTRGRGVRVPSRSHASAARAGLPIYGQAGGGQTGGGLACEPARGGLAGRPAGGGLTGRQTSRGWTDWHARGTRASRPRPARGALAWFPRQCSSGWSAPVARLGRSTGLYPSLSPAYPATTARPPPVYGLKPQPARWFTRGGPPPVWPYMPPLSGSHALLLSRGCCALCGTCLSPPPLTQSVPAASHALLLSRGSPGVIDHGSGPDSGLPDSRVR